MARIRTYDKNNYRPYRQANDVRKGTINNILIEEYRKSLKANNPPKMGFRMQFQELYKEKTNNSKNVELETKRKIAEEFIRDFANNFNVEDILKWIEDMEKPQDEKNPESREK